MKRDRLDVTYVLEDTALFGGVKIVLQQANLIARRGHRVTVVSKGERPSWFRCRARFVRLPDLAPDLLPPADVTVATFWTTIEPVSGVRHGQPLHYCQGFEASYTHNRDEHPAILAAYARPMPAIALAPHLAELVRTRFGRAARVVPPPLEPHWRPALCRGPHRPPRIAVLHPYEIDWKGVRTALETVLALRRSGLRCRLLRVSQWPLGDAERAVLEPDEFHCGLTPQAVARVLRSADLLLAPSWEQEGFGLPVLEAMASGVPVVASDIAAFRGFASEAAVLVPGGDVAAFAAAAAGLLEDRSAWGGRRRAGLAAARSFAAGRVALVAEEALRWAASGAWRDDAPRGATGAGEEQPGEV